MKPDETKKRILNALLEARALAFELENEALVYFIEMAVYEVFDGKVDVEQLLRPPITVPPPPQ